MKLTFVQTTHSRGAVRLEHLAAVFTIVLLAGLVGLAVYRHHHSSTTPAGGRVPDVGLVGVWPDGSDDLLDASGRKIGQSFYCGSMDGWGTNTMARAFVFAVSNADNLVFTGYQITPSPDGNFRTSGGTVEYEQPDGTKTVVAYATLPEFSFGGPGLFFRPKRDPIEFVDIALYYVTSTNQTGNPTSFNGPFQLNRTIVLENGAELTPIPSPSSPKSAGFHLALRSLDDQPPFLLNALFVYDRTGRRRVPQHRGSSRSPRSVTVDFFLDGLPLDQVASVVLASSGYKTFQRVRVRYPDRPALAYPAANDKIAAALEASGPTDRIGSRQFSSPAEVLKVIDLVRGSMVVRALNCLRYAQPRVDVAALPAGTRARVQQAAERWAAALDPQIRLAGIELGLLGGWAEFIAPALRMIGSDDSASAMRAAQSLAAVAERLSPSQLDQIRQVLLDNQRPLAHQTPRHLIGILVERHPPWLKELLLTLAQDDRVGARDDAAQALSSETADAQSEFPSVVRERVWVASRQSPPLPPEIESAARQTLARLFVPVLNDDHPELVWPLFEQVVKKLEVPAATRILADFLRQERDVGRYSSGIQRIIRQLNQWHGKNFGRLGRPDEPFPSNVAADRYLQAVRDVLEWYDDQAKTPPPTAQPAEVQ